MEHSNRLLKATSRPEIAGYQVDREIGQGSSSIVYRVLRNHKAFALKMIKTTSPESTTRFRRESAALARLNHPNLVKIQEVGEFESYSYLVMDLVEGENLSTLLAKKPLEEKRCIEIGIALAEALSEVHRHGLVHRDIKPNNVIVKPNGEIKLIDFGFVMGIRQEGNVESKVAGTFLYAPPEQTGMLKRPIDARSDLYALGALLFECAVGRPPFSASNTTELLRMHAAVPAPELCQVNPAIRTVFSAIISKLLSKDPDERYQTTQGLINDLKNHSRLEAQIQTGKPLELAKKDSYLRISDKIPLVGRSKEVMILKRLWANAKNKQGEMCLISGEAGSGKTRLVREIIRSASTQNALILMGKAQKEDTVPFGPIRAAVDDFIARTLRLPKKEKDQTIESIREAAGEFGSVIKRLSRGLEKVFADAEEISLLDPAAEQERFYDKIAEFFCNLSRKLEVPILFLVDDVQWLDTGSLYVLRNLSSKLNTTQIFLAVTARNDQENQNALQRFSTVMGDSLTEKFSLSPLDLDSVEKLITEHMGGIRLPKEIVERLATAANGNPFAIGQYIHSMLESGILRPFQGTWEVESKSFAALSLSRDVLQLVVNRLSSLSVLSLSILKVASIIGMRFELDLLSASLGENQGSVFWALNEALQSNIIEEETAGNYLFVHDRLIEALRSSIPENSLKDIHQSIAEALDHLNKGTPESIHALARHYANGHTKQNPKKIYETSRVAGLLALDRYTYNEALELLQRALSISESIGLSVAEEASLREALGVAYSRAGEGQKACEFLQSALALSKNWENNARLHHLLANIMITNGDADGAFTECERGLAVLGIRYPKSTPVRMLTMVFYLLLALFLRKTGLFYGSAKGKARKVRELSFRLAEEAGRVGYFRGEVPLFIQMMVRQFYYAHFLGTSPELAQATAYFAFMPGLMGLKGWATYNNELAITMAEQLGDRHIEYLTRECYATNAGWMGNQRKCLQMIPEVTPGTQKWCSPLEIGQLITTGGFEYSFGGRSREAIEYIIANKEPLERSGAYLFLLTQYCMLYTQNILLGNLPEALKWKGILEEVGTRLENVPFARVQVNASKMWVAFEQEDFFSEEVETSIRNFIQDAHENGADEYFNRYGYAMIGYLRLEQYTRSVREQRKEVREKLVQAIKLFNFMRANPSIHSWHLYVLKAGLAREDRKFAKAIKFLEKAEKLSTESITYWGEFGVAKAYARLYARMGDEDKSQRYGQKAFSVAVKQGWRSRAKRVKEEFSLSANLTDVSNGSFLTSQQYSSGKPSFFRSDFGAHQTLALEHYVQSLLKVSLASSSSLDPQKQAQAILDEVVRLLGAERAFLFLCNPKTTELLLHIGRDTKQNDLFTLEGYSSTVVNRVKDTLAPLVVTGTEEGEAIGSESAVAHELRSIMAVPLMLREEFIGVLYMDSRLAKGLFTQEDVKILLAFGGHIAISISTARTTKLEAARRALEKDLALIAAVQSFLLPKTTTYKSEKLELTSFYQPADQCGGDWWWFENPKPHSLQVFLGDVTGHGAASAMVTGSVASSFQCLKKMHPKLPVSKMLSSLSSNLREMTDERYFMTMSVIEIDMISKKLHWWNAGATPVYILQNSGQVKQLCSRGTPLGTESLDLGEKTYNLVSGERVFIFTDGLPEMRILNGRELGWKKLLTIFEQTKDMQLEESKQSILQGIQKFQQETPQADDITFVLIDIY